MSALPEAETSKAASYAHSVLSSNRRGFRALLPFLGPAFIAAVAYIDPGNYATNIQGGSEFGYNLLWVIVMANLMAMLIQNMSAKLGIATGKNLPELCRERFPRSVSITLWIFSEVAAMATDIAEFLGATLALNLLVGIPLLPATVVTGILTYFILMMDRYGYRPLEIFIGALVLLVGTCYGLETWLSHPAFGLVAYHSVVPWIHGPNALLLVVGIVGATVMPHVVYLHSGLTQRRVVPRDNSEREKIYRFSKKEVIIAMTFAGLINLAMMYMAAASFHSTGHTQIATIPMAYRTLTPILGSAAAAVFLISLLASGVSSSAVGTMAGQLIMQGFVGFKIPVWVRRVVTMLPTVIIVAMGLNPTEILVLSQVLLSLVLPVPIVTLIYFASRRDIMGPLVNRRYVTIAALASAFVIVMLNGLLIYQSLGGAI